MSTKKIKKQVDKKLSQEDMVMALKLKNFERKTIKKDIKTMANRVSQKDKVEVVKDGS